MGVIKQIKKVKKVKRFHKSVDKLIRTGYNHNVNNVYVQVK